MGQSMQKAFVICMVRDGGISLKKLGNRHSQLLALRAADGNCDQKHVSSGDDMTIPKALGVAVLQDAT